MPETTPASAHTILVVDDEANIRKVLAATLRRQGWQVLQARDGAEAIMTLKRNAISTVISDMRMPDVDGMTLLRHVTQHYPDIPVIMLTAFATVDTAVEALKLGAFDYTTKPFETEAIQNTVQKAIKQYEANREEVASEHATTSAEVTRQFGIIGASQTMQQVFRIIERVANTPSTVLISGESGTGKELIAKAMHHNSSRRNQPFIKINCAAIPEHLVESELFGHERGAFTGAVSAKPGRFELANGGTLFLDEIGEVPLEMQVKLLRVLQESEFERVGGVETLRVDVRLVAATNRDLPKEIEKGTFREDFYYRLNVVPIMLPPLRDRPSDIPALAKHFIARNNNRLQKSVGDITERALVALQGYPWPGNIRELENLIERTMLFLDGDLIDEEDLPHEILQSRQASAAHAAPAPISPIHLPAPDSATGGLKEVLRETTHMLEKQYIMKALDDTGGNVTQAAKRLQISRKSLQNKMKEFGLREVGG
jgi:two-component system response regulator AtoC